MKTVVVSLFAGMGGFDLAARWMGWDSVVICEIDPLCQVVLKHHFPDAYIHGDIHTLTGDIIREKIKEKYGDEPVRVVGAGGFPCQSFSGAGKRAGVDDNRYLWPEVARIFGEFKFDGLVFENVAGLTSISEPTVYAGMESQAVHAIRQSHTGIFDEPAKREKVEITFSNVQQRVMGLILQDIEDGGYQVPKTIDGTPIVLLIPACGVGAPHRRDRVWFVASRNGLDWDPNIVRIDKKQGGEIYRKKQGADSTGISYKNEQPSPRSRHEQPSGRLETEKRQQPHGRGKAWSQLASLGVLDGTHAPKPGRKERIKAHGCRVSAETSSRLVDGVERFGGVRITCESNDINDDLSGLYSSEIPQLGTSRVWGDNAPNANGKRLRRQGDGQGDTGFSSQASPGNDWQNFPTESPLCNGNDGIPSGLGKLGFVVGGKKLTMSSINKAGLKMGGNAIVPQVALQIFRALQNTWK